MRPIRYSAVALFALGIAPAQAWALQPLEDFLAGAKSANFDAREQGATVEQRSWEASAALGRLLPAGSARGVLQYNQYEAAMQLPGSGTRIVVTPQVQKDAFLQLDVPLVDVAGYYRYGQARHLERAAEAQRNYVDSQLTGTVTRTYFVYVGASAVVGSAEKSLRSAEDNLRTVTDRAEFGAATSLDVARAGSNLERARQDLADATLSRQLTARNLETLTGLRPTPVQGEISASLEPESPVTDWLDEEGAPANRVQQELLAAARSGRNAAMAGLLPTLSASAQERFTNATGFAGHDRSYLVQGILSWRLDWATYANARAQGAAETAQQVRRDKVRRTTADAIYEAYLRIDTGIAKCRSTRAQAEAARKAAELAEERYRAGAATQLDVTQAQRDAFAAEVGRVQADADLLYSRVQLRALSGKPVTARQTSWLAPTPTPPVASVPGAPVPAASSAISPTKVAPAAP